MEETEYNDLHLKSTLTDNQNPNQLKIIKTRNK